jgi:D-arabinose 1-dehydrogenase-like Zn-dependent alcohol dehydrogenase
VGGTGGYKAEVPVDLIFVRQLRIIGSSMGSMEDARQAFGLIFSGKVTPIIDSVYTLDDYVKAVERLQSGAHFGKIVIDVRTR